MDTLKKTRKTATALSALGLVIPFAGVAVAQSSPGSSGGMAAAMIEEITVTARKREEGLQSTPISITAFSGDQLDFRGLSQVNEIAQFTPNLTFQNNPSFGGSSNSAAIFIRGIGQSDFLPLVEPGVGIYVDGVYVARTLGAILDLVDIERIEVLRGPQGTLFGRNTIGGAISITTQQPEDTFSADLSLTGGTDTRLEARASVNIPLSDKLFARIAAGFFRQDGYVVRPSDGLDLGNEQTETGRIAVKWTPSERFTADLQLDATQSDENGPATTLLGINFAGPIDPNTPPFATINNVLANVAAGGPMAPCATPAQRVNPDVPGCFDESFVVGDDQNFGTAPSFSHSDIFGASLNLEWQALDTVRVRSITAYRNLFTEFARDGDASPLTVAQFFDDLEQEQFSQELQVLGESFGNRLEWILGFYYFKEDGNSTNILNFVPSIFQSGGDFSSESIAGFAQATYAVTDRLDITGGIRYTRDEKSFLPRQEILEQVLTIPPFDAPFFAPGTPILPKVEATETFRDATPMVNLSFQATDALLTYFTYSQGFKSGGFSQRVFPPVIPGVTAPPVVPVEVIPDFDPERVNAYEVGVKYSAFDNRLRVNAGAFYTDYDDLQVQVFTSVAPVLENAAGARIAGFEFEGQATPGDDWFLEGSVGFTDAEYTEIDEAETLIASDNEFARVPRWTASASVAKEIFMGDYGSVTPRVAWSYNSGFFNDAFNTPNIATDDYNLVDLNVVFRPVDERYEVIAGVNNVGNEDFLETGIAFDAAQTFEGVPNRGRQWFITLKLDL